MTTSNDTKLHPTRSPLRLRMADRRGRGRLDGGWWPQSRDLALEIADLVDHFPAESGRVVHACVSPPDWDTGPRRVPVAGGFVTIDAFARDDTHLVLLRTADHALLRVLVVPSDMSSDQGEESLLAASSQDYEHSASCLLETVLEYPDVDPDDQWADDGGGS